MENNVHMQEFVVEAELAGERLDRYLTLIYANQSRSCFQKLIKGGNVSVNGKAVTKAGYVLDVSDVVTASIPEAQSVAIEAEDIPLNILYVNAIMYHCADSLSGINGEIRPGIVHRIDMDTTGALIVCKNDTAHTDIAEQIKEHTVTRRYRGIVCGVVKEDEGIIEGAIGRHPTQRKKMAINEKNGKPAITHYKVLQRFAKYTYMEFQLETGRTHQIRVHMASIGHPLLGDELYGNPKNLAMKGLQGQTLHAMIIGFVHPSTHEYMEFEAPLPEYFQNLLLKLSKQS